VGLRNTPENFTVTKLWRRLRPTHRAVAPRNEKNNIKIEIFWGCLSLYRGISVCKKGTVHVLTVEDLKP
jgi:hypothetical protein